MHGQSHLANFASEISNLASGHISSPEYTRRPLAPWSVPADETWLLDNVNIIDVDSGKVREERACAVRGKKILALVKPSEVRAVGERHGITKTVDGAGGYLIPGLSDIHSHVTLVSEYDLSVSSFRYFHSQRLKNAEETIKAGCTFIRDSGGAVEPLSYIKEEIDNDRLMGPKIFAAYGAVIPRGGMWDMGKMLNPIAAAFFGGNGPTFSENVEQLQEQLQALQDNGADFFKTYYEEKPLYGFEPTTMYKFFSDEQTRFIREFANKHGKMVESHSMFIKGSRIVIEAGMDTLAHLTVDESYSLDDARKMASKGVAIVPTLSVGLFLTMNMGSKGIGPNAEVDFFMEERKNELPKALKRKVIPELYDNYVSLMSFLDEPMEERKMPGVGQVYPERCLGFARCAPDSIHHFQDAGVKVGVGTDAGTGVAFCGELISELRALHRYGYTIPQVLRMATLGNMEILHLEDELGSITPGKYADMTLLAENPLENLEAIKTVRAVFKDGRLMYRADDSFAANVAA